jgi:outer membrane immunogenic protein
MRDPWRRLLFVKYPRPVMGARGGIVMRALLLAAGLLLMTWGTAASADLPRLSRPSAVRVPAATSLYMGWSGFYFGVNAGGGIGNSKSDFSVGGPLFASVNNAFSGAVGGGQAGFNWQSGLTVIGLETDLQASGIRGSLSTPCIPGICGLPLTATYNDKVPWFGTVRGRLGAAASSWLMYVTGGYAYARIETDALAAAGMAAAAFSLHDTKSGWTAGGGIEVALAPGWSAKLEYLYLDFGHRGSTLVLLPAAAIVDDAHFTMNVVRVGVNYRL